MPLNICWLIVECSFKPHTSPKYWLEIAQLLKNCTSKVGNKMCAIHYTG